MNLRAALQWISCVLFCLAASGTFAAEPASVGVVFMHGKWGSPDRVIDGLTRAIAERGFLVATPEMPWSRKRAYDRSVEETIADIEGVVRDLRAKGAKRIVVGGHSLGAALALAYAGRHQVDGLLIIAPGHNPGAIRFQKLLGPDVARARAAIAAGKGSAVDTYADLNTGDRTGNVRASATAYLSYFDPDGPMTFLQNAKGVKAGTAVLWAAPTREDGSFRTLSSQGFRNLPPSPGHRHIEPEADHIGAPAAVIPDVLDWLNKVLVPGS